MDIINEVKTLDHFKDRIDVRFTKNKRLDVILVNRTSHDVTPVGHYILPDNVVDEINKKLTTIMNSPVTPVRGLIYGFIIYVFRLYDLISDFKLNPQYSPFKIKKIMSTKNFDLKFHDPDTGSSGRAIAAVLNSDRLTTVFYSNFFNKETLLLNLKRKNPNKEIIYVENPEDLEFYDDDIVTNNF